MLFYILWYKDTQILVEIDLKLKKSNNQGRFSIFKNSIYVYLSKYSKNEEDHEYTCCDVDDPWAFSAGCGINMGGSV